MDPKIIREIQSSPQMSSENPNLMSEWGGPQQYIEMARIPVEARQTFYAVQGGATSPDEVAIMTGLSDREVSSGISFLTKRGFITRTEVVPESGIEPGIVE